MSSLGLALRLGVQLCASEPDFNLGRAIPLAERLSVPAHGPHKNTLILLRIHSGVYAGRPRRLNEECSQGGGVGDDVLSAAQGDFLINWTTRSTAMDALVGRLGADPTARDGNSRVLEGV